MPNVTPQNLADGRRWEGSSLTPYRNPGDVWTQGIGHTRGITEDSPAIDPQTEVAWFIGDWDEAYEGAASLFPRLDEYDVVRRDALIWLVFNMGVGKLAEFKPFIAYVGNEEWGEAGYHLMVNLSGYLTPYLRETGARAVETALRIVTGEIRVQSRAGGT